MERERGADRGLRTRPDPERLPGVWIYFDKEKVQFFSPTHAWVSGDDVWIITGAYDQGADHEQLTGDRLAQRFGGSPDIQKGYIWGSPRELAYVYRPALIVNGHFKYDFYYAIDDSD